MASVKIITEDLNDIYDWRLDMLSPEWSATYVRKLVLQQDKKQQVGDLLLNAELTSRETYCHNKADQNLQQGFY